MRILIRIHFKKEISCDDFCSSLLCHALKGNGFRAFEKDVCNGHIATMICDQESIFPLMRLREILSREKDRIEKVDIFEVEDYITYPNMLL